MWRVKFHTEWSQIALAVKFLKQSIHCFLPSGIGLLLPMIQQPSKSSWPILQKVLRNYIKFWSDEYAHTANRLLKSIQTIKI